jgi:hypothetical protein
MSAPHDRATCTKGVPRCTQRTKGVPRCTQPRPAPHPQAATPSSTSSGTWPTSRTVRSRHRPCPEWSARDVERPMRSARDIAYVPSGPFATLAGRCGRALRARPAQRACPAAPRPTTSHDHPWVQAQRTESALHCTQRTKGVVRCTQRTERVPRCTQRTKGVPRCTQRTKGVPRCTQRTERVLRCVAVAEGGSG